MKYEPHAYQEFFTEKIISTSAVAGFLEMGLGKSICTLTAIVDLMHDYFDIAKVLVIAPLRVARFTWEEEIKKWDHTSYLKLAKC